MKRKLWTRRHFTRALLAGPLIVGRLAGATVGGELQPRLFLTPDRLASARRLRGGPLATAWRRLGGHCDQLARQGRPKYRGPTPHDSEMLWQRTVGNSLPTLALGYLLSGKAEYKQLALGEARDACGYAWWGGPTEAKESKDLAAGHLLFGMSLLLDWLAPEMDSETRNLIIGTLERRGARMVEGASDAYWARTLLQNHLWVCMTGLMAAGLALQPHDPVAAHPFIATAVERMQPCIGVLPPDGSDQEGPAYWSYGAEYLLKYHQMATELLGLKLDSEWFRSTQRYCIAFTLPLGNVGSRRSIFNFADATDIPYYGPEYLLRRLASLGQDGAAQEMADRLEAAGAVSAAADWLNFVWYDERVRAGGLDRLPAQQYFDDLDLVVSRSGRGGRESVVIMRSGPPLGKRAQGMRFPYDIGTAHTHPDINHITLFGSGEMLLADNGYAAIKDTAQHNTLLVSGRGQVGSGKQWTKWPAYPIPDPQPALKVLAGTPVYEYWVGEGAAAYPPGCGLQRFDRHVLFLKPDALVVIDDVEADEKAQLQFLWHPGAAPGEDKARESYTALFKDATLRIRFHLPDEAQIALGSRRYSTHDFTEATLNEIEVRTQGGHSRLVTVFAWGSPSADPVVAWQGARLLVRSGKANLTLDVERRSVSPG